MVQGMHDRPMAEGRGPMGTHDPSIVERSVEKAHVWLGHWL